MVTTFDDHAQIASKSCNSITKGSVVIKHCIQQGIVAKGISPVSSRLRQAR